jgi:hypothetical protein
MTKTKPLLANMRDLFDVGISKIPIIEKQVWHTCSHGVCLGRIEKDNKNRMGHNDYRFLCKCITLYNNNKSSNVKAFELLLKKAQKDAFLMHLMTKVVTSVFVYQHGFWKDMLTTRMRNSQPDVMRILKSTPNALRTAKKVVGLMAKGLYDNLSLKSPTRNNIKVQAWIVKERKSGMLYIKLLDKVFNNERKLDFESILHACSVFGIRNRYVDRSRSIIGSKFKQLGGVYLANLKLTPLSEEIYSKLPNLPSKETQPQTSTPNQQKQYLSPLDPRFYKHSLKSNGSGEPHQTIPDLANDNLMHIINARVEKFLKNHAKDPTHSRLIIELSELYELTTATPSFLEYFLSIVNNMNPVDAKLSLFKSYGHFHSSIKYIMDTYDTLCKQCELFRDEGIFVFKIKDVFITVMPDRSGGITLNFSTPPSDDYIEITKCSGETFRNLLKGISSPRRNKHMKISQIVHYALENDQTRIDVSVDCLALYEQRPLVQFEPDDVVLKKYSEAAEKAKQMISLISPMLVLLTTHSNVDIKISQFLLALK